MKYQILSLILLLLFVTQSYGQDSAQLQIKSKSPEIDQQSTPKQASPKKVQPKQAPKFIDENNDGYNDIAPDQDGDGIPNGIDSDFKNDSPIQRPFIDENVDGLNDHREKKRLQQRNNRKMDLNKLRKEKKEKKEKKINRLSKESKELIDAHRRSEKRDEMRKNRRLNGKPIKNKAHD